jgi:hypothetical protein
MSFLRDWMEHTIFAALATRRRFGVTGTAANRGCPQSDQFRRRMHLGLCIFTIRPQTGLSYRRGRMAKKTISKVRAALEGLFRFLSKMYASNWARESGSSERRMVGGRLTSPNSLVFMRFIYRTSNEVRAVRTQLGVRMFCVQILKLLRDVFLSKL